jgi:uncharacterized iron-regulated protein
MSAFVVWLPAARFPRLRTVVRRPVIVACSAIPRPNHQSRRSLLRSAALVSFAAAVSPGTKSACASTSPLSLSLAAPTVAEESLRHSVLFELASGSLLPVSSLQHVLERLQARCLILGEVHDEVATHAAQLLTLQVLQRMDAGRRPLVVAFEQFYRGHTPILLDYTNGKISLDSLLSRTNFEKNWGYSAALYVPILRFCRMHKIRMVGMNIPGQVVTLVSRVGLDALPQELRRLLPETIDLHSEAHFNHFLSAMGFADGGMITSNSNSVHGSHESADAAAGRVMRYYEAQCLWDEVMSETISGELRRDPSARVIGLVGTGHIDTRTAIPDRVKRRSGVLPISIVTRPVGFTVGSGIKMPDIEHPERCADVVWYTSRSRDIYA